MPYNGRKTTGRYGYGLTSLAGDRASSRLVSDGLADRHLPKLGKGARGKPRGGAPHDPRNGFAGGGAAWTFRPSLFPGMEKARVSDDCAGKLVSAVLRPARDSARHRRQDARKLAVSRGLSVRQARLFQARRRMPRLRAADPRTAPPNGGNFRNRPRAEPCRGGKAL